MKRKKSNTVRFRCAVIFKDGTLMQRMQDEGLPSVLKPDQNGTQAEHECSSELFLAMARSGAVLAVTKASEEVAREAMETGLRKTQRYTRSSITDERQ